MRAGPIGASSVPGEPMRRLLVALAAVAVAGLATLVLVPVLLEDRVVALLVAQVNARVDADVALGDADLSLVRSFPDLELGVRDLVVTGRGPFAGVELVRVGRLEVGLDLGSVLGGGPVRVTGLTLAQAEVDVRTDAEGRSNTALVASQGEASAGPSPELWLEDVVLEDVSLRYADVPADRRVVIDDLDLAGDAEVGDERVALRAKGGIAALSVTDGGVELARAVRVTTDLDVRYGPTSGAVELGPTRVGLNELGLTVSGTVEPQAAGTALDLAFAADRTPFKGLLSLVPGAYTPDFAGVEADGTLAVKGTVKGLLPDTGDDLPAFDVGVSIADGRFRYPGLPAAVSGIQLELAARHPGGNPDAVGVDVPRFRMEVDGAPLEGRFALRTPVSDPAVDTRVKGRLDLGRLAAAFPESVSGWTGVMDVDVDLAGKVSAFSAGDVDAVRAAGTFTLTDATWTDPDQPLPITVQELQLAVDPRRLDVAAFRLRFGQSDLSATGAVENALGWALGKGVLTGRFSARSSTLDLDPWSGGDEPEGVDGGESSLFAVPTDLDLALDVDVGRVRYADWDLRDVRGGARVKDGTVRLDDVRARTLGGELGLSGTYAAPTDRAADVDLRVTATDLGAAETLARVETLRRVLPGVQELRGTLRSGFGVKARLGPDLSPELASLASVGTFGGTGLVLTAAFLSPVAEFLGDPRFGQIALDGGDVGFEVDAGKLQIDRLPVKLGPATGALRGHTGVLDASLDLVLDLAVPATAVRGAALSELAGRKVETVDVRARIGGTWAAPTVKVGLGESLKEGVTEVVKEQVGAVVDAALERARAQGDRLVAEAEKAAEKLVAEAKKQGDRLRDEADAKAKKLVADARGNPLKEAAAKEAAKALRTEADKAADKLEKEAAKKADAGVAAAKKERDRLIAEAERRAP